MSRITRIPHVQRVTIVWPHVLELHFDDGLIRTLEFIPQHGGPMVQPLDDPEFFARVTVDHGTLAWPNGLDLDPVVLHGDQDPVGKALFREIRRVIEAQPLSH